MRRVRGWAAGVAGALWWAWPDAARACATCVASAFGDRTFNWAFLALMIMPFVVAGVIGSIIVYAYRRGHESGG
jgi:hypothetical protein